MGNMVLTVQLGDLRITVYEMSQRVIFQTTWWGPVTLTLKEAIRIMDELRKEV